MKRLGALTLALAIGLASVATGSARADQTGQGTGSGAAMSEMMRGPMSEMMRGTPMGSGGDALGRERPLLSLALRHRAELGLSEDQVKALQGLVDRFRQEAEKRLGDIETAERELAGLLKEETADPAKVEATVRAIEKLRADLRIARIRTIAEGRAALTPGQRTKLEGLVAGGRQAPRGERPGGAGERGPSGPGTRGVEEMHRFMSSERMPQAMTAMMEMARRMGDGDMMLGMVRMMDMMSQMGEMMGGGMMGGSQGSEPPREQK